MISLTAEYALRAVTCLAEDTNAPRTVQQIAEATRVPMDYLSKVLQELAKGGLVRSQRGLYGGFRLIKDPTTLSAFDVVQAVSPIRRIDKCPLGREHDERLCHLHQLLDDAMGYVEKTFRRTTISNLTSQSDEDPQPWRCADPPRRVAQGTVASQ